MEPKKYIYPSLFAASLIGVMMAYPYESKQQAEPAETNKIVIPYGLTISLSAVALFALYKSIYEK